MSSFRLLPELVCVCAIVICLAGCTGGDSKRYAVSGEVRWRGRPLDRGAITFLPENPSLGTSGGAMIKDGRYDIPARNGLLPGRYKVMVNSADPKGVPDPDAPPGPSGPLPKDRVNAKYNAQTVLSVEVMAKNPNVFEFDVD